MRSSQDHQPTAIDKARIRRYLEAQPFRGVFISDDEDRLFFFEELQIAATENAPAHTELKLKMSERRAPPGQSEGSTYQAFDLANGKLVSPLNFLAKSASVIDYYPDTNELLMVMDEANEEKYNLFLLDLGTGLLKQLTKVTQALMARPTHDRRGVWFISREPKGDGTFISTLCLVDLQSAVVTRIFNDELTDYKLNFVAPMEYTPERIFIFMDKGARRHEFQLFDVNLRTGERQACLDEDFAKHRNYIAADEPNGDEVFFLSMKSGFENLYAYNVVTREVRALTNAKSKNSVGLMGLAAGCEAFIYQIFDQQPSRDSELVLSDLEGKEFLRQTFSGGVYPKDHRSALWVYQASMTQPPRFQRVHGGRKKHVDAGHAADVLVIDFLKLHDEREREDFVHCTRQVASYKSFDGLEIPAFLFLPKKEIRGAIVIAFYGGEDYYVSRYQMYLEQGIAILSPAVRGSWSWGQEWENRLKGDLGGAEILDVIWGARFVAKVLDLPEQKIGVEGGSHGGYAALRAMTMPADFRGVDTRFDFGFGVCWAGFADLIEFHKSSWISDWLVDLLGPLPKNESLYRERSPVNFVEHLRAPLFISHGRNDRRVPLSTMTEFIEKLKATPFANKILIQEGEGHKGGGLEKELEAIGGEFEFVDRILTGKNPGAESSREHLAEA